MISLPPDPQDFPYKVAIHKDVFKDSKRGNRAVPVKFTYPQGNASEKYPIVIWSHGLGGSRDGAGFLARYLASHGFIVVNVQHPGTDSSLWEGKSGHPWDNIRASRIPRKATLQRFQDIPFILDQLKRWVRQYPQIGKFFDLENIGMSGHSFGAVTAQIMAGQALGRSMRKYRLHEPRFKAAIAYSPSVTYNHNESPEQIYGSIAIPLMYMTGTRDSSPVSGKDYRYRLEIFKNAKGPDQYMIVLDDADHMVFAGSRGKLGATQNRQTQENVIKSAALVFWQAYLKQDKQAIAFLKNEEIENWIKPFGRFSSRNISQY